MINYSVLDTMDSLKGATLIKADGSKVEAEAALQDKVGDYWHLVVGVVHVLYNYYWKSLDMETFCLLMTI